MKLHETIFWQTYDSFTAINQACTMRSTVDAWVYYKLQTVFDFQAVLEIGFSEGQTAGLLAEVSGPDTQVWCVDPRPNMAKFQSAFAPVAHKIILIKQRSQDIDFGRKDFIIIDGDKKYDAVKSDITKTLQSINTSGVIAINEWILQDVVAAIADAIDTKEWKPFLRTHQSLFFHHVSVDRSDFLDYEIKSNGADSFMRFVNHTIDHDVVLQVDSLPIFTDRLDYFDRVLRDLNL